MLEFFLVDVEDVDAVALFEEAAGEAVYIVIISQWYYIVFSSVRRAYQRPIPLAPPLTTNVLTTPIVCIISLGENVRGKYQ